MHKVGRRAQGGPRTLQDPGPTRALIDPTPQPLPDLCGRDLAHDLAQAVGEAPDQGLGREGLEADITRADKLEVGEWR